MSDQGGGGESVEASQLWSDGDGAVVGRRWSREWRILIWSWTIDWSSDYWLVETVRHEFLGEESVHRYGRLLWQIMVWAAVLLTVFMLFSYWFLVSVLSGASGIGSYLAFLHSMVFLMVIFLVVVVYFTYVPPKM